MIKLKPDEIKALTQLLQPIAARGENKILTDLYRRLTDQSKVQLYVDGAADLHSKTAGIGGALYRNGEEIYSFSEYVPDLTNNEAEYRALIQGLKSAIDLNLLTIEIYADSELIVRQINGEYKVRNPRMKVLYDQVYALLNQLEAWSLTHVPREENRRADTLSKQGREKGLS
jgi:ribonuclease HI